MDGKRIGELTIFRLDADELEDAALKNRCLRQTRTPLVAYVEGDAVEDETLLRLVSGAERDRLVAVWGENPRTREVDYGEVLELLSVSIRALLFSRKLIRETGAFHEGLTARTNFELLCRLTREAGKCLMQNAEDRTGRAAMDEGDGYASDGEAYDGRRACTEEDAYTLAYVIRRHLSDLHALGLTDRIFTRYCEWTRSQDRFPAFRRQVDLFLKDEKAYERIARRTAPFVILRGDDTCGGVLQGFADDLSDALIQGGEAVIRMDDHFTEHEKLQNMVCKGVVGFQSKALEIDFFRQIHGLKFQFWFDNPLHFENVLRNLPEEYHILCQDANYASYIRDYYHTRNAIQFPPGGKALKGEGRQIPRGGARPYDLVFVGSYFAEDTDSLTGMEREFYDHMLANPCETFERGLSELLYKREGEPDAEGFADLCRALKPVCRMVIGHHRNAVISTILAAGFTVHVYGEDWRSYAGIGRERLVIHPRVTAEESLEELAKAKIGLNVMSWHKAGMTERVANIMLSGAVCLTEETDYLRERMEDGQDIVCFRPDALGELPGKIEELLGNPKERERIAGNAYEKASAEHTWARRAEELVALAESGLNGEWEKEMKKIKKIVLFQGELDTVNLFSDRLRRGFLELGYEIFDFDLRQSAKSLGMLYQSMQEGPITAMIAFNSLFFKMTLPSGENMWEALGIPCINILVDHPYWYHDLLTRMPATGIVLCIDRNHMNYVERFYPNIPAVGFLPHGGASPRTAIKPISERGIDVLYAGSLYADRVPRRLDLSAWDFPAEQICDRSIEYLLAHPEETIEDVLERQLRQDGVILSDEELRRFISSCVHVERAVSSHYRERIVGSVAEAGISLNLYGEGWEKCDWIGLPNVHYGGRVAPEKILSLMGDSKIVLNTLPWFKDGGHERVFNAMLCGAVAVSETSKYLEETLPSDAWVPFDLSSESLEAFPRRVLTLLADEEGLEERANASRELALAAHTWEARARELHEDLLSML